METKILQHVEHHMKVGGDSLVTSNRNRDNTLEREYVNFSERQVARDSAIRALALLDLLTGHDALRERAHALLAYSSA
jgi:hypothetical protein